MKFYVKGARLGYDDSLYTPKANKPTPDNPNPKSKFGGTFIVETGTQACFAADGDGNPDTALGRQRNHKWGDFKTELTKAIVAVAQDKLGPQWEATLKQLKAQNRLILHSGEEKGARPGYEGNYYFNANSDTRPELRGSDNKTVTAQDGIFYSGCYVDGVFDVWAFPKRNSVNISLLGVKFARDGERLAGGATATDEDYAEVPAEAQAAAASTGTGAAALF